MNQRIHWRLRLVLGDHPDRRKVIWWVTHTFLPVVIPLLRRAPFDITLIFERPEDDPEHPDDDPSA